MKVVFEDVNAGLSEDDIDDIKSMARDVESDPEGFKKASEGVNTIVISKQVQDELEKRGISQDEFVAMIMQKMGKIN